ncbi:dTDP-4-dehydrorhamnose 3,5-epimerase [Pelotalea chapellei]|uniref:dTDP-4-dehydrorhamnose 3,5-epimerase n=1 Tax=Pelotalea chapellei TaxID=44671 RepID=A0ABS5U7X3_9BACT|nr:dTDP-4-dehydrorhamnose 3,5-epimerase [Pelotalea chapellei]MBT1071769.1 dTDP-4-dehydrorhamnose 3,5-epimerase [Pelotalea chapellei]
MTITQTSIPEVLVIEPKVFGDDRGFFFESFNERLWHELTGLTVRFVQHNHSRSAGGVLRGLHYQIQHPQGKLVRVIKGEVYDVAVDLRRSSPTCGRWFGTTLSEANKRQMWVPPGFGHGFCVTSDEAEFLYLTTDFWSPEHERCIAWNDPELAINWPLSGEPILSVKDRVAPLLKEAELFP